jgi:hypothetical protein
MRLADGHRLPHYGKRDETPKYFYLAINLVSLLLALCPVTQAVAHRILRRCMKVSNLIVDTISDCLYFVGI